ncbi:antitoxin [Kibdelosporangium persicum]|uniref:Antitoxin protein of toxin-antitoxin system n=1 Tax=Kibdelosporangium persicum TaxID=2698649 RepID=A0ABX2F7G1_9PSEU|nr:antitoxin [Kibdelosporangium persicum]NRN67128.1 Antitoxin protein of toxin-antitoxin system [Kibdelosporangium persicum]
MFEKAKEKLQKFTEDNPEKTDQGIDKAAELADEKTGGKHGDKIQQGADKLKDHMQQQRPE